MPPKNKFSKEQIIETAFEIALKEGVQGITVQKVAKNLKSSVAPIYVNFTDIEQLKKEIIKKVFKINDEMNEIIYTGNKFLDMGIASFNFAREYPVLFKEFINHQQFYTENYDKNLEDMEIINEMKKDKNLGEFSNEDLLELLIKMRIFTIGLATAYINGILPESYNEEACIRLLNNTGNDIINSLKEERKNYEF